MDLYNKKINFGLPVKDQMSRDFFRLLTTETFDLTYDDTNINHLTTLHTNNRHSES